MHLYHTFVVRLFLLGFAVTALLPSQCCHHVAVTPFTFHNQTVKLQSVTDDSKFIFLFIRERLLNSSYKCNISFLLIGLWMQSCLFIPIKLRTERNIKSIITIRRLSSRQCRGPFRHPFNNAESLLCKFRMSGT